MIDVFCAPAARASSGKLTSTSMNCSKVAVAGRSFLAWAFHVGWKTTCSREAGGAEVCGVRGVCAG